MANQGAKKRKEENSRHMKNLLRLIIACNVPIPFTLISSHYLIHQLAPLCNRFLVCNSHLPCTGVRSQGRGLRTSMIWDSLCLSWFLSGIQVIYLVVRAGIFHSTFKWKQWVGFMLTFFAYIIPYQQLASMANPAYTDDGELLDGGFDMSTGGICGYLHDVIYITGFVQLASIVSEKFWYIYLVIPAFAAYKLIGLAKGFLPGGSESEEGEEDEKTRKKREKMEKRASRPKFAKTRTR
ncbi:hypothetical protein RHMOL_Rhmol03G0287900 [Rhododendron molle]|uniref:Uncharacterized protein n=1 Tax=Rhododendron molle TaxID=49168 RepID=A0ACC0PJC5_RHOML|nr:hypothetical protein RHMOL_Rhmol03G0287900 [Rhododendron molle]